MKRTSAPLLLIAAVATVLSSGCAGAPAAAPQQPAGASTDFLVEGYPLDRSLDGVSQFGMLESAVVLTKLSAAPGVWLTDDGRKPALNTVDGELVNPDEPLALATPVKGHVKEVLWGAGEAGTSGIVYLDGGEADGYTVEAAGEIAVSGADLAAKGTVVAAGTLVDKGGYKGLQASFLYEVGADGETLTSLLESASEDTHPVFTLTELRQRLRDRTCALPEGEQPAGLDC
ncbi:hypothetical protein [Spirilliplanes yamanashiensis]|uniref:Uncharacterized protein n=1 Tax=Spirilliplanes yamanashiensis TaxID=42233 RepID=A0A8J3YAL7_9ACTN|nr:hypothetical protein [Spirilliplanes yamanashiensis]MDP9818665.1 hypothetical protein [Spirilliplanes yamanashiensis]GIJ05121.1 hypothetical protein Sya03_44730 [Spirilliplanes yamanashiensis]